MTPSAKTPKWNALANFIGLGYATVIGLAILPLYLQYLGAEAFGLVGFFLILQGWMHIFDLGMSPLLARQTAQARGQNADFVELRKLLRSLEIILVIVAALVFMAIVGGSGWISDNWLKVASLKGGEVSTSIVLMGAIIGLRFFASLYRSGVQGMENQVQLNVANMFVVTLRYVGALLLLKFFTQDVRNFFVYQFAVGVLEALILSVLFYRSIPAGEGAGIKMHWRSLQPVLPFTGGIAYAAAIWVLVTQLDKLVVSNVLPLAEYGFFSLAAIVGAGISQVGAPISQAILPRMTFLLSKGDEQGMVMLYRQATQAMAVIIVPLTAVFACFSEELLFAWTGDRGAAEWAGPVLFWFALGNGILAMGAFQFYLQYAHGHLKMHVIYISLLAGVQIPLIIYAAYTLGVMAVVIIWFALRLLSFIIWTPIVHRRFAQGIHLPWLFGDIGPSVMATTVLLIALSSLSIPFEQMSRLAIILTLLGTGLVMLLCNTLVSRAPRNLLIGVITKRVSHGT